MNKPPNPFADLEALRREAEVVEFPTVKKTAKAKRSQRWVGVPLPYMVDVCRLTEGRTILVVALLIYRRTRVCSSLTVTLPKAELVDCGINRSMKRRALCRLAAVGLIRIEPSRPGRPTRVTLLWEDRDRTTGAHPPYHRRYATVPQLRYTAYSYSYSLLLLVRIYWVERGVGGFPIRSELVTAPPTNARHQSAYGVKSCLAERELSSWAGPAKMRQQRRKRSLVVLSRPPYAMPLDTIGNVQPRVGPALSRQSQRQARIRRGRQARVHSERGSRVA